MNTKLITYAEELNDLRIEANATPELEAQSGVYGLVAEALKRILMILVPTDVDFAYEAILNGCTVEDAITQANAL